MPSFATQKVADYFRGVILSKLTNIITEKLYAEKLSVVNINANIEAISEFAKEKLQEVFASYGVALEMFQTVSITVNENDPSYQRLKETKDALARINIMGKDNYRLERSFNVLEGAAENEGGAVGAAVGIGAGFGLGKQISAMVGQNVDTESTEMPPLPTTKYHLGINGQSQGPFDVSAIIQSYQSGQITLDTLAWCKGMANWTRIADIAELSTALEDCLPPLPPM